MYVGAVAQVATTVRSELGGVALVASDTLISGTQTISLTGLDLGTDNYYIIVLAALSAGGADASFGLYVNADMTATNYRVQRNRATGGAWTLGAANEPVFGLIYAGETKNVVIHMWEDVDGHPRAVWQESDRDYGANLQYQCGAWGGTTTTNVTSIQIYGNVVNCFTTGTRVDVYKMVTA